jgi:hypothetical protein
MTSQACSIMMSQRKRPIYGWVGIKRGFRLFSKLLLFISLGIF